MDPAERLTPLEEKARYELHQNQETEGYRNFFKPLIEMILRHRRDDYLTALDFGCGPEPVLANLMVDQQFEVSTYDPLFNSDNTVLNCSYNVITCTEVWEHLRDPVPVFDKLQSLLQPGGILAVMTSAYLDEKTFQSWSYRRDLTHIGFFTETTMLYIANRYGWNLIESECPYWMFAKNN